MNEEMYNYNPNLTQSGQIANQRRNFGAIPERSPLKWILTARTSNDMNSGYWIHLSKEGKWKVHDGVFNSGTTPWWQITDQPWQTTWRFMKDGDIISKMSFQPMVFSYRNRDQWMGRITESQFLLPALIILKISRSHTKMSRFGRIKKMGRRASFLSEPGFSIDSASSLHKLEVEHRGRMCQQTFPNTYLDENFECETMSKILRRDIEISMAKERKYPSNRNSKTFPILLPGLTCQTNEDLNNR